jgi:hypothetical protein
MTAAVAPHGEVPSHATIAHADGVFMTMSAGM